MSQRNIAAVVLSFVVSSPLVAQGNHQPLPDQTPVADRTIERAWADFEAVWQALRNRTATFDDLLAAYDDHIETLPFERMSSEQIASMSLMTFQFGNGMERSVARLEQILKDDPDDLHALIKLADLLTWAPAVGYQKPIDRASERRIGLINRFMSHPDLHLAVDDGSAAMIPTMLGVYGSEPDGLASRRQAIDTLVAIIERSEQHGSPVAVAIGSRWDKIKSLDYTEDRLLAIRDVLLPHIRTAMDEANADEGRSLKAINMISDATSAIAMLTSAAATRDFVGMQAPPIDVIWSSDDRLTSLNDLRGKVLLIQFWVTGCGHCMSAIPHMQELAEHYHGTDVAIVGVTSIQGVHSDPEQSKPIDTRGHPEREFALMQHFIETQDVSWPIVFTSQSAWNPDYEVRGTPHLTLLDPNGVVVANDMHPQHGFARNSQRIDAVLTAFNLDTPGH